MTRPGGRTSQTRFGVSAILGITAVALLPLVGCGGVDEDALVIYSGRSENLIQPLIEKFESETGQQVEVRYADSVDLALRLGEEKETSPADVFISQSPGAMEAVNSDGLLETVSDEISELGTSIGGGTSMALSGRQRVVVYNTDEVDEADLPASIFDLTDSKYDGLIGIAPTNASFQDWFTIFRSDAGEERALEWLTAIVDGGAKTYENNSAITQAVARGDIYFGLTNHYYNARILDEDPDSPSKNHQFDSGDEGGTMLATAAGILKSGKVSVAEDFVSFLLSEDAQRYFADETFEYPLAAGVEPDPRLDDPGEYNFGELDKLGDRLGETLELIREAGLEV